MANRRLITDLQQQVGELATREHVAVKKLLDDAGQAARNLDDAQTRGEPLSVSLKFADEVRLKLRQALAVGEGIERGTKQRTALGSVLLEQNRASRSEFWATGAPTIRKRLDDLQKRYVAIGQRIERGDVGWALLPVSIGQVSDQPPSENGEPTDQATGKSAHPTNSLKGPGQQDLATQLAELQADLIALFEDNLLARQALQVRVTYEREKRSVSERVQKLEGFVLIHKTAQDGEQEFELGDFKAAATNFGRAVDRLEEYLKQPSIETAEEKQNRQRVTVDLVKVLETDKAQLQARIAQLTGEVDAKLKQVSDLQTHITQLSAKQLEDQAARKTVETKLAAAEIKAKDVDQTKASLTKTTTELETAKQTLAAQQKKLIEVEPKLAKAEQDRDQLQREADQWKKRATENPGVVIPSNLKPGDLRVITVKGIPTRWRWIPAGKFKIGSPPGETGRDADESQADVTISKGFWMLETEVTQELWIAVMGSRLDWKNYGTGARHPVYHVSHNEATEFCGKFHALLKAIPEAAGLAVRLPTEAEWEYSARAGTTTRYYWGDRDEDADQYEWHAGNSNKGTQPVGQKQANAWGLHDMSGNVWEWCSDWYADKLVGGNDPRGPSSSASFRVLRGGSWRFSVGGGYLRSANRYVIAPVFRPNDLGFRLACSSVGG